MNILFYTSFNERSITLESTAFYLMEKHNLKLLTTAKKGEIHKYLIENGIESFSSYEKQKGYIHLNEIKYLRKFIKLHNIDIVHAHLQLPSLYSSIVYTFCKFKLLTVRHNSDVIYLQGNKKEIFIEKITNTLSPCIVAISEIVKLQLIEKEGVNPKKIFRINNGYNFANLRDLSNDDYKIKLKHSFNNKFIVLLPGRFIETKRHKIALQMMVTLIKKIPEIHLIFVGEGPYKNVVKQQIKESKLEYFVSILDFTSYIADLYDLANIVIQTSESEASNNVIKEALFFNKPVLACKDVGDFREYLHSSMLIDKYDPLNELENNIMTLYKKPNIFKEAITISRNNMLSLFSMKNVGEKYDKIHENLI